MPDLRNLTFEQLLIYIAVVETGSLTRAAQRLGIGKTAVSKCVQRLEAELGSALIVRTTRQINVTEAGASFFATCRDIVRQAEEALSAATPSSDDLQGTLRVAASVEFSAIVLAPVIARMRIVHPRLRIELVSGDRQIDMIEEGIDVAIRLSELIDSSHRAIRVGTYSKWLVASPDFIQRTRVPDHIAAAGDLAFVALSVLPHPLHCTLHSTTGESLEIDFADAMFANTVYVCRAAAQAGAGIALLPDFAVRADVAKARLARLFPEWSTVPMPIQVLLPPGRHTAPKVGALAEMLRAHLAGI